MKTDRIDINTIDDDMCYLIWRDFHEQYKPFFNSFVKLTNYDTTIYIVNKGNQQRVIDYINEKLEGLKIMKLRVVGHDHILFFVRRTDEESASTIIRKLQNKIDNLTSVVESLEEKMTKIYYSPNMPGYQEALYEFNSSCELEK